MSIEHFLLPLAIMLSVQTAISKNELTVITTQTGVTQVSYETNTIMEDTVSVFENITLSKEELQIFDEFIKQELNEEQASLFTQDFIKALLVTSKNYNIDPWLVISVIDCESSFKPNAISRDKKHFGLMQLSEKYHMQKIYDIGGEDIFDPIDNITVGIMYLAEIRSWCKDVTLSDYPYACPLESLMVMSYNKGFGVALPLFELGETTAYTDKAISKYLSYKTTYGN